MSTNFHALTPASGRRRQGGQPLVHAAGIVLLGLVLTACTRSADQQQAGGTDIYTTRSLSSVYDAGGRAGARTRAFATAGSHCLDTGQRALVVRVKPTMDLWNRGDAEIDFRCVASDAPPPATSAPVAPAPATSAPATSAP